MEKKKSTKLITAVFIIVSVVLFLIAIFVIGSKQNLFTSTFKLHSVFVTVSGLQEGSSVRFNGITVATVDKIEIISGDKVKVDMIILSNVKMFIKKDSKIKVISEGLIGNKIMDITPGSENSLSVKEDDMLESIKPIEAEDILKSLKESGDNASIITRDISHIVSKVDSGEGTLGQLINNKSMYNNVDSTLQGFATSTQLVNYVLRNVSNSVDVITTEVVPMTEKIRLITEDIADITRDINSSESLVGTLLTDTVFANNLKSLMKNADLTSANLEQGSFSFSQNMEALKHNFLFKGYFEDIGYWDKTYSEKNVSNLNLKLKIKQQEIEMRDKKINDLEKMIKDLQANIE